MADALDVEARELSRAEWEAMLDSQAQHYFRMTGDEFRAAWEAGEFDDDPCQPGVQEVAMLLPLGGPDS